MTAAAGLAEKPCYPPSAASIAEQKDAFTASTSIDADLTKCAKSIEGRLVDR